MEGNIHVKKILITQDLPNTDQSPYNQLGKKYSVDIDFLSFFTIQTSSYNDVRKQKIDINNYTAIIFTSRINIDQFFTVFKNARVKISPDLKYFCTTEQILRYLNKYIVVKKRKSFVGKRTVQELLPLLEKHAKENYLIPSSNMASANKEILDEFFTRKGYRFSHVTTYEKKPANLSDFNVNNYQIIAFFSPSNVSDFLEQFPNINTKKMHLATFGQPTYEAISNAGLQVSIKAPTLEAPSMYTALENFLSN